MMKFKTRREFTPGLRLIAGGALILGTSSGVLAEVTQEDFFRSVNQNMNSTVDLSKTIPYLLSILGVVILLVLYHFHRQRKSFPHRLNSPGKLTREICRRINLRSNELRQLKILADEQQLEHPLTLILCPSALGKAIRTPSPRVDRAIVKQIVQRLRQSLSA
jgi:hypothetical protein